MLIDKDEAQRNFAEWFGESKVVDQHGRPLVVYHGTQSSFDNFNPDMQGDTVYSEDVGFFFTNNHIEADAYAMWDWDREAAEPNVLPVFLSLKNPLFVNIADEATPGETPARWYDEYGRAAAQEAIAQGHDGLIVRDFSDDPMLTPLGINETLYVAFRPEQIKSIFNRGLWDPASPSLTDHSGHQQANRPRPPKC